MNGIREYSRWLVWILIAAPFSIPVAMGQDRPSLLFLLADDQRADTIGGWGNRNIRTVHLDRLVQQGMSFRKAYCMGSIHGAVCVPSRAMIMGGRTLFRSNMKLEGQTTFPQLLGEAGYRTFGTGKWHNGQSSFARSFQESGNVMFGGMSDHSRVPIHDQQPDGSFAGPRNADGFSSTLFADAAIGFLESCDGEQPFFCYVAFTAPHDPRMPPPPWDELYRKDPPPLPANFMPQHPFDTGQMAIRDEVLADWPRTEPVIRDQLAEYYGMISQMDQQIGRILKVLDDRDLSENTIVVFAADHGLAMGSHGLLGKQSLYEHSMLAPLIIRGRRIAENSECQELVYLHDLYPTFCEYAGVKPPQDAEGSSLRPLLEGRGEPIRDSLFTAYAKYGRALRDGHWKLIRWPQVNHTQLFNLAKDPHELENLAGDPAYRGQVDRMLGKLVDWQLATNDWQPLWVAGGRAEPVDLNSVNRKPDRWQPRWIVDKYFGDEETDGKK